MSEMIPFRFGKDYTMKFDALAKRLGLKRPFVVRNLLSLDPILIDDIEDKAKSLFSQMAFIDAESESDKKLKKVPEVITIRLDKEQERRFGALVESLGAGTRVQVLRNLLSGDPGTVATICKKAKAIPPAPKEVEISDPIIHDVKVSIEVADLNEELFCKKFQEVSKSERLENHFLEEEPAGAIEELVRKKVSEFEKELRVILAERRGIPNTEGIMIPEQRTASVAEPLSASDEQSSDQNEQASGKPKKVKKKKIPSGVDHSEERRQIMDHFNLKADRNLSYDMADSIKAIDKMLDAGKPVKEFKTIIDNMCYWWKDISQTMYGNLFPRTIFRVSHWDEYLAKVPARPKGHKYTNKPPVDSKKYDNFYL